jgi:hypothetical protein
MTSVTESLPDLQHPVALAFAVAALQSVEANNSIQVPTTCEEASPSSSLLSSSSMMIMYVNENDNCFVEHSSVASNVEQSPRSGSSDSVEAQDDPTVATTLSSATTSGTTTKNPVADASSRLARSRDRNREHARRTRIRKKAQLAALKTRQARLEAERVTLRQSIEECSIAGILLGLHHQGSSKEDDDDANDTQTLLENASTTSSTKVALLANGKRKRFLDEDDENHKQPTMPLRLVIEGKTKLVGGGKSHINWKTGVYIDHQGLHSKLTMGQLENLRYVLFRFVLECFVTIEPTRQAMLSCIVPCTHARHIYSLSLLTVANAIACTPR